MKRLITILILLGFFIFVLIACDDNNNGSQKSSSTIEQQMAIVDAGKYIEESDIKVTRFRYLLNTLQKSTGYDSEKIGDMVAKSRNIIREKYGKEVTLIQIMEAACKSEAVLSKSVKLEEYLAIYTALAGQ